MTRYFLQACVLALASYTVLAMPAGFPPEGANFDPESMFDFLSEEDRARVEQLKVELDQYKEEGNMKAAMPLIMELIEILEPYRQVERPTMKRFSGGDRSDFDGGEFYDSLPADVKAELDELRRQLQGLKEQGNKEAAKPIMEAIKELLKPYRQKERPTLKRFAGVALQNGRPQSGDGGDKPDFDRDAFIATLPSEVQDTLAALNAELVGLKEAGDKEAAQRIMQDIDDILKEYRQSQIETFVASLPEQEQAILQDLRAQLEDLKNQGDKEGARDIMQEVKDTMSPYREAQGATV